MTERELARGDLLRTLPDAQTYLDDIDANPDRPTLIKASGETLASDEEIAHLSGAAGQLSRAGLPLVITHGGGPQIKKALEEGGFESEFAPDGLRITPPEAMPVVAEALAEASIKLEKSLKDQGVKTAVLDNVMQASLLDEAKYGMVGEPEAIDTARIQEVIDSGRVAIIPCLGWTALDLPEGQPINVNGDDAAAALVKNLNPLHYLAITKEGGVRNGAGRIEPVVTPAIAKSLKAEGVLNGGMEKKVREALDLLDESETDGVVLASVRNIIREIFTHTGAGSLITKEASIREYSGLRGVNTSEVRDLIENAFGGHLSEDYFTQKDFDETYITSQRYDGVAIVRQPAELTARYIDKLAVAPRAQWRGVPRQILESVIEDSDAGVFWRADPSAVFLDLYEKAADGWETRTSGDRQEWRIFYKNMKTDEVKQAIEWTASQPVTVDRHPEEALI